jgi:hypothetical protein
MKENKKRDYRQRNKVLVSFNVISTDQNKHTLHFNGDIDFLEWSEKEEAKYNLINKLDTWDLGGGLCYVDPDTLEISEIDAYGP